jgi:hypothetical protein
MSVYLLQEGADVSDQPGRLNGHREFCLQAYKILLKVGFSPSQIVIILNEMGVLPSSKSHAT